jgi:hypothetical protein
MRVRPLVRILPAVALVMAVAGFVVAPATTAGAAGPATLTVHRDGPGGGTITGTGISCNDINQFDCTQSITDHVTAVTLIASAYGPYSSFGGWTVSDPTQIVVGTCGGSATCSVTVLDGGLDVSALFNGLGGFPFPGGYPYGAAQVQVNNAGTGTGTVTSSNIGGINCGTDCNEVYGWATGLTLTAIPNAGSSFAGWNVSGGATNVIQNGNQISLNLNWANWDWNTWPWNVNGFNNFNYSTLVTATFNTATATVATAAASTFTHLHQHGGIVTGRVHHGVHHAKKHVHAHTHAL